MPNHCLPKILKNNVALGYLTRHNNSSVDVSFSNSSATTVCFVFSNCIALFGFNGRSRQTVLLLHGQFEAVSLQLSTPAADCVTHV
jgi:hypothetical protein